jgi:hypothetical protein
MAHENILIQNPAFDAIIDRMCEEGIGVEEALRKLDERPS